MAIRIVLLRGVNVGGRHRLPMGDLARLMRDHGYADARTYIQSGNIVFDGSARKAAQLGPLIEREFGFRPGIFALTDAELARALRQNPFRPREGKHLHFFFCDPAPGAVDTGLLDELKSPSEEYHLADEVLYLHAPDGIARSQLVAKLAKAVPGVSMTARNLNTVQQLARMAGCSS